MNKTSHGPKTAGSCGSCSPNARNHYYRGKTLRASDYRLEQDYHVARRHLVSRAMLGWGVVHGFECALDGRVLTVERGLGLDPRGREVFACEAVKLDDCHDFVWLEKDGCGLPVNPPLEAEAHCGTYLLSAHYAEKDIDHVRIDEGCGEVRCEANRICETVAFSLRPVEICKCGLPDCRCRNCGEQSEPGCGEAAGEGPSRVHDRGTHAQLARWNLTWLDEAKLCDPAKLVKAGCIRLDPAAGVPLACVEIGFHCGEPFVEKIVDAVWPRRLAMPNELLFDLIRGCDLTRIEDVGWCKWLAPDTVVPFSDFAEMFKPEFDGRFAKNPVRTNFRVRFTGPVQSSSLTSDVITVTLLQSSTNEDLSNVMRIPVVTVVPDKWEKIDPKGTTRGFSLDIGSGFYMGEIDKQTKSGFETETVVEIEIRCDFIDDCNGQMVAGGGRTLPSRGTVPGGRFLTSFTVVPDHAYAQYAPSSGGAQTA